MGGALADAAQDLIDGLRLAPLWLSLGWQQTLSRFRRTLLGPFWISVGLLFIALALTILWGGLTGVSQRGIFATMISGLLGWSLIGGPLGESASAFLAGGAMMQTQRLPLSFYIYLLMFKAFINFVAQLLALWLVFLLFRVGSIPAWPIILGLPLVIANVSMLCVIIAIPSTRFRDVNQLVGFGMQILFFLTPVFWSPLQMNARYRFIIDYNPLDHLLELIRQPLIGRLPTMTHFAVAILLLFVSSGVAIVMLSLYRKRVVFWL